MKLAIEEGVRAVDRGIVSAGFAEDAGVSAEIRTPVIQVGERGCLITEAEYGSSATGEKAVHGLRNVGCEYRVTEVIRIARLYIPVAGLQRRHHILPVSRCGTHYARVDSRSGRALETQLTETSSRREVIYFGLRVHNVERHRQVLLRQQPVRESSYIRDFQGDIPGQLAPDREVDRVRVGCLDSVV